MTIVLPAKLRRPEPGGLSRPRLERPLLQPLGTQATGGLDLVIAPAGSGKTTLLAQVAAAAPVPVAWYRVTVDDDSEAAFAAHLHRALSGALASAQRPDEPQADPAGMTELLARWDRLSRPVLVVLDDVHEIGGTAAERALRSFVEFRPPAMRVLIGARRPPDLNIPRLRLSETLREWSGEDLRFRSWEVEELFVTVFAEPLPPEAAAALTRRTGGWAAALQLFHLSTAGRSAAHRAQAVVDLGLRYRLIRSYLVRNVLDELPAEQRLFLVRTSSLGVLTGELCDALLETTGSHALLEDLERRQLFTFSDDDGRTFRYHEVLRAHLELSLVDEYGPAAARAHYQRSGELLESAGRTRAALLAYAKAENWANVTRLIRHANGEEAGIDLGSPAGAVVTDPWLALTHARRLVRIGAFASAVTAYRRAQGLLDEPEFGRVCRQERAHVARWTPEPSSGSTDSFPVAAAPQHWADAVREALRGRPLPPHPDQPGWRLAGAVSTALAGDLTAARTMLDELLHTFAEDDAVTVGLLARLALEVLTLPLEPDGRDGLGALAQDADAAGLPWAARVAHGVVESTGLLTHGAADWRVAACARLAQECEEAGDVWGAAIVGAAAAICTTLAGAAVPTPDAAADRFDSLDAPVLALWVRAIGALRADPVDAGLLRRLAGQAGRWRLNGLAVLLATAAAPEPIGLAEVQRLGLTRLLPGHPRTQQPAPGRPAPDRRSPELEIGCFGRFRLLVDGTEADLAGLRPMARAVLRLLALGSDTEWHRERLVDLFWPDTDLPTGTRRLQVVMSSIRQALEHAGLAGGELIRRSGDGYRLVLPDAGRIDVREFERACGTAEQARRHQQPGLAVTAAQEALGWYRGDLLPEDGAADPVVQARERYRLLAAGTALGLARDLHALDRVEEAVTAARRSVELDPYRDESWTLLAALYEGVGDRSAARRARADHARAVATLTRP